jgi:hypothetical protein
MRFLCLDDFVLLYIILVVVVVVVVGREELAKAHLGGNIDLRIQLIRANKEIHRLR